MTDRAAARGASGLVLLDEDGLPRAAEPAALELLGAGSLDALRRAWPDWGGAPDAGPRAVRRGERIAVLEPASVVDRDGGSMPAVRVRAATAAADAAGWQALANVARPVNHDVRGPLNAAVLHLDLLGAAIEAGAEPPAASARAVRRNLARVEGLLRAWLAAGRDRTDAGGEFDALEAAQDARRLVRPLARKRRVRVSSVICRGDARNVRRARGDVAGLGRALLGALVDAVGAAPPETRVRLELVEEDGAPVWRLVSDPAAGDDPCRAAELLRSGGTWTREPEGALRLRLRPAPRRGIG